MVYEIAIKHSAGEFVKSLNELKDSTNKASKAINISFGSPLNGKFGAINSQGKEIIPLIFDELEFIGSAIRVAINYQFGVINYSGEYILPCEYDRICLCNDIIIATKTNKELIFDEKGELIAEKH